MKMFSRKKPASGGGGKTLIVHIGDHKTGSTSIQNAFAAGRVYLSGATVDYPAPLNHNYLKPHFAGLAAGEGSARRVFNKLADQIRASSADYCLISAEEIAGIDAALVHRAVTEVLAPAADDLRVIGYVRPHAAKLLSSFAEQTKIGNYQRTLDAFVDRQIGNGRAVFVPRFGPWHDLFGDALTLLPMQRELLHQGSVVHDFVHNAFGGLPFTIDDGPQENESLGLEDLMRIKVVQSRLQDFDKQHRHTFGWEMARMLSAATPTEGEGTRLRLSEELAAKIDAACRDDAQAMDARFFGGTPTLAPILAQAVAEARGTTQPTRPEAYLSAAERRSLEAFGDIVAAMMGNGGGNWPTFFRNRRIAALSKEG